MLEHQSANYHQLFVCPVINSQLPYWGQWGHREVSRSR